MISEHVKHALRNMILELPDYVNNTKIKQLLDYTENVEEDPLHEDDEIAKYQALESLNNVIKKAEELEMNDQELLFVVNLRTE